MVEQPGVVVGFAHEGFHRTQATERRVFHHGDHRLAVFRSDAFPRDGLVQAGFQVGGPIQFGFRGPLDALNGGRERGQNLCHLLPPGERDKNQGQHRYEPAWELA